jgi:hypothetical protein
MSLESLIWEGEQPTVATQYPCQRAGIVWSKFHHPLHGDPPDV